MVEAAARPREEASEAFRRLAVRARLTAVSASVLIVVPFLALLPQMDLWSFGFFLLAVLMGILYVGANPWMAATDFRRAAQVVSRIPALTVLKARGFMFPRITLAWPGEQASGRDDTLRFSGGIADEYGGSQAEFRIEMPMEAPGDVVVSGSLLYSDFPEVMEAVEEASRALAPGEYLWSNVPKRRFESVVVPDWGHLRRPDETADSVAERLLARRKGIDAIRMRVEGALTFSPRLVRRGRRAFPGPFSLGAWCPQCRRAPWMWTTHSEHWCHRCKGPLIQVLSRYDESLRKKMERVNARGIRLEVPT